VPPAQARTPFDEIDGIDVEDVLEPEAVLEGETFEEAEPEPEAPSVPEPVELLTPEPEKAPVQELIEPEPEPEPAKVAAPELPELKAEPEPELTPEPEPEPKSEPELKVSPPEPVKTPARDETTESGVWTLEGAQPKPRAVEAEPAPLPEPVAKPRPPVDLGELPPAPEEPMQLAATWEFMGMAEAQGHSAAPASEDRSVEMDTSGSSSDEDTGSPQDAVALASTWDFVPQWQPPPPPAAVAEASPPPPSAPVVEKAAAAPVKLDAPVDPITTAKYGLGTNAPANPTPFDGESAEPVTTGKYGVLPSAEEPPAASAEKAEPSWDQMFPPEEPASSGGTQAPEAAEPVLATEADPFTEFATEAARKRDGKSPAPEADEDSGSSGGSST
jgi:hypothetical protein